LAEELGHSLRPPFELLKQKEQVSGLFMETQRQGERLYENKEGLTSTTLGRSSVRIQSAVFKDRPARFLNPSRIA
jgi:hypothetical protein